MKIAIVTTGQLPVPATKGGAVENLLDFFLEENERTEDRYELDVYSCFEPEAAKIAQDKYPHAHFEFIRTDTLAFKCLDWFFIKLNKVVHVGRWFGHLAGMKIRKENYDAILVENFPFHCPSLKYYTKSPILLHTHNRYVEAQYPLLSQFVKSIDGLICVSDFIARDAEKAKVTTHDKFPVSVAHNGIHVEKFYKEYKEEEKLALRKKLGISESQKIVIFTGRFIPAKGVKELVLAFRELPHLEDYVLLIIGASAFSSTASTPYIEEVKSLVEPIKDHVKFTGYVDYKDIPAYYAISHVQAVPSIWEEPAGLVSLEGMAAGLAIVSSDSGGTPEHVTDECAITVKRGEGYEKRLAEALHRVLSDDELRTKMAKAGRERSRLFSTKCYYKNMSKSINEVLSDETRK